MRGSRGSTRRPWKIRKGGRGGALTLDTTTTTTTRCDPHSYDALVILVGRLVLSYLLLVHCSSARPDPSLSCPDPPRVDCHSVRKVVCWLVPLSLLSPLSDEGPKKAETRSAIAGLSRFLAVRGRRPVDVGGLWLAGRPR
jgi:hypothetical protein